MTVFKENNPLKLRVSWSYHSVSGHPSMNCNQISPITTWIQALQNFLNELATLGNHPFVKFDIWSSWVIPMWSQGTPSIMRFWWMFVFKRLASNAFMSQSLIALLMNPWYSVMFYFMKEVSFSDTSRKCILPNIAITEPHQSFSTFCLYQKMSFSF